MAKILSIYINKIFWYFFSLNLTLFWNLSRIWLALYLLLKMQIIVFIYLILLLFFRAIILISKTKILIIRLLIPTLITKILYSKLICWNLSFWKKKFKTLLYQSCKNWLRLLITFNNLHTIFQFFKTLYPLKSSSI